MRIDSIEQIADLKKKIYNSADTACVKIKRVIEQKSALDALYEIKFNKVGVHPIEPIELNIIEQINQLFSDLIILEAVADLIRLYPEKKFEICLGNMSGFDVESIDGDVVAECFAVTTAASNNKLKNDSNKLLSKAPAQNRYIYFYSQYDSDEALERLYARFPAITYKRIRKF